MRQHRVPIMLSEEELRRIDDYRFSRRIPTRSRAIRELCAAALNDAEAESALSDAIERDPTFPTHGGLAL